MDGDLHLQDAPATAASMARTLRVGAALGDAVRLTVSASAARQIAGQIDRALRDAAEVGEARAMLDRAQGAADRAARDLRHARAAVWLDAAVLAGFAVLCVVSLWVGGVW